MRPAGGERRLERAAALLLEREVVPGPAPLPDFVALGARRRGWRRRLGAGLTLAAAGVLAGVLAVVIADRGPVAFVVAGDALVAGDRVETTAGARLSFSEGTEVTLRPGARLAVARRTRHGAVLELERGQAGFSVVHRRGARWSVVAGPFAVQVTGTEFTVDWEPRAARMIVDLKVGTVRVDGVSVGGAVELHAGERLVATAGDHRLTLGPRDEVADGGGAASPGEARAEPRAPAAPAARDPSRVVVGASRERPRRMLALASPGQGPAPRPGLPEVPVPVLDGERRVTRGGPGLGPPPSEAPSPPPRFLSETLTMGGGGLFCVTRPAQYSFEDMAYGLSSPREYSLALTRPRIDHTHSWCGESSVRMDAAFDQGGRRNYFGRYADETGQLVIKLGRLTDLTGKTVTMHVFVEGPPDARFSAEIAAVQHGGWASGAPVKDLTPGRWWTVRHRFSVENATGVSGSSNPFPYPNGGTTTVAEVDRLALAIHVTGDLRTWKGAIYVDDISW